MRPVQRVLPDPGGRLPSDQWPMTIPAVAQLVSEGLELNDGVTFLIGENGSGKSTLVEAVAMAYGLSPEGGTRFGMHSTRSTESSLHRSIRLVRGLGTGQWGFFLRAETMHSWYTFLEDHPADHPHEPRFHEMSHGESFLAVLQERFDAPGLYVLDEPEAALSFTSTLTLIKVLTDLVATGAQVLCATHSPVLAALPGATIIEVGDWGLRRTSWEELQLVRNWRSYLAAPDRYLHHLLG